MTGIDGRGGVTIALWERLRDFVSIGGRQYDAWAFKSAESPLNLLNDAEVALRRNAPPADPCADADSVTNAGAHANAHRDADAEAVVLSPRLCEWPLA